MGPSIVTEADSLEELRDQVRDAVRCHFEGDEVPKLIQLHFVRDKLGYQGRNINLPAHVPATGGGLLPGDDPRYQDLRRRMNLPE